MTTNKPTLNQADVNLLIKGLIPQIKTVVSLVITGELIEQEEKFEKHVTESHSKIFDKIDPVLKEVKASQEARTLIEERVEALEDIHQTGKHSLPSTN